MEKKSLHQVEIWKEKKQQRLHQKKRLWGSLKWVDHLNPIQRLLAKALIFFTFIKSVWKLTPNPGKTTPSTMTTQKKHEVHETMASNPPIPTDRQTIQGLPRNQKLPRAVEPALQVFPFSAPKQHVPKPWNGHLKIGADLGNKWYTNFWFHAHSKWRCSIHDLHTRKLTSSFFENVWYFCGVNFLDTLQTLWVYWNGSPQGSINENIYESRWNFWT